MYRRCLLVLLTLVHCSCALNFTNSIPSSNTCECVPFLLCDNGIEITDGAGIIEIRSIFKRGNERQKWTRNVCEDVLEICCEPRNIKLTTEKGLYLSPLEMKSKGCGIRNYNDVQLRIMSQDKSFTKFAEYPWMIVILIKTLDSLDVYKCGGSLIHRKVVLTAAHCVYRTKASSIKIRAGEWDTQSTEEILPHRDYAVDSIIVHKNFNKKSLKNDFALLILADAVMISRNIDIVCLPESQHEYDDSRCTVTGWGKNKIDGHHQEVLKSAELSMVSQSTCEKYLRRTTLGKRFMLDNSFVCAGGSPGEDTCKGDGGSPLICPLRNDPQRFVQVGVVSWGIGCGSNIPGVYANVLYARTWIDEQLMFHNLDSQAYQNRLLI